MDEHRDIDTGGGRYTENQGTYIENLIINKDTHKSDSSEDSRIKNDRQSLFENLKSIPQEQLLQIIFILNPPKGIIPSNSASQGQQVFALLQWADGHYGCGLEQVQAVLDTIVKPHNHSNSSLPQVQSKPNTIKIVIAAVVLILIGFSPFSKGLLYTVKPDNPFNSPPSPLPSSPVSQPKAEIPNPSSPVIFSCGTSEYEGKTILATIMTTDVSLPMFEWKLDNNYFGDDWTPPKRCEEVAKRLQKIYENGGFKFLVATLDTWDSDSKIPVICLVKAEGDLCHQEDLLITLQSTDDPNGVLLRIADFLTNYNKYSIPPIPRTIEDRLPKNFSEGKRMYYDISGLLYPQKSSKEKH